MPRGISGRLMKPAAWTVFAKIRKALGIANFSPGGRENHAVFYIEGRVKIWGTYSNKSELFPSSDLNAFGGA